MNQFGNDPIRNLPSVPEPRARQGSAATWQIVLTMFGLIAIVSIFFWGINNQRDETAGEQPAATTATAAAPQTADAQKSQAGGQQADQQTQQRAPSTTGQGGGDQKDQPQHNGKKANGAPVDSNSEPAQRQSK